MANGLGKLVERQGTAWGARGFTKSHAQDFKESRRKYCFCRFIRKWPVFSDKCDKPSGPSYSRMFDNVQKE